MATGRLDLGGKRDSERRFSSRPYDAVLSDWRAAVAQRLRTRGDLPPLRVDYAEHTYPQPHPPALEPRASSGAANLRRAGIVTLAQDHRQDRYCRRLSPHLLADGLTGAAPRPHRLAKLIASALVAHHMITFARECTAGQQSASFYADSAATGALTEPARRLQAAARPLRRPGGTKRAWPSAAATSPAPLANRRRRTGFG